MLISINQHQSCDIFTHSPASTQSDFSYTSLISSGQHSISFLVSSPSFYLQQPIKSYSINLYHLIMNDNHFTNSPPTPTSSSNCSTDPFASSSAPSTSQATPECELGKEFEVLEVLGSGSFGIVVKAQHRSLERLCAIKRISRFEENEDSIESIFNEIDILESLEHPSIIELYTYHIQPRHVFITLEFAPGGDLEQLVSQSTIPEQQTKQILLDMGSALDHFHSKHIIHRDLKLANVLIGSDNRIRISDFGLASEAPSGWVKGVCGTPYYQAPEMLRRDPYGQAVDWWAVGVMLYEMVTGDKPFKSSMSLYP